MICCVCGFYDGLPVNLPGNFSVCMCEECRFTIDEMLDKDAECEVLFKQYGFARDSYEVAMTRQLDGIDAYDSDAITNYRESYYAASKALRGCVREVVQEMKELSLKAR